MRLTSAEVELLDFKSELVDFVVLLGEESFKLADFFIKSGDLNFVGARGSGGVFEFRDSQTQLLVFLISQDSTFVEIFNGDI